MMDPADTFEHAGLEVRICWEEFDTEHANPRDCSNLGVMFCDHRDYKLGDEDADDPREQTIDCPDCEGSGSSKLYEVVDARAYGRVRITGPFPTLSSADMYIALHQPEDASWVSELADCERCEGSGEIEVSITEYLKREHDSRVVMPLFLYDHSGITISSGNNMLTTEESFSRQGRYPMDGHGWDVSSVGVIYDTAESRKEYGCEDFTAEQIEKQLDEEVAYYAAYLEGNVYGYQVVDEDGEVLDSCWGFLELNVWKDDAAVRTEAKFAAEHAAEQIEQEKIEAHRWACADVVTV